MALHPRTTAGITLSGISVGLSLYQHFFHPAFDLRLIASVLSIGGYFLPFSEFPKYASKYQVIALFIAVTSLGLSVDHLQPFTPSMTVALLLSMTVFKKFFREWFSETDALWLDPAMSVASACVYVFGGIFFHYGWQGWLFPLPILLINANFSYTDTRHGVSALNYYKGKARSVDVGKIAPQFQLPDREGKQVGLGDFKDKKHVLLIFIRNDWCPSCRIMLRTYEKHRKKFSEKNVQMLTISPGTGGHDNNIMNTVGIQFNTLYDEKQEVCKQYGVQLPLGQENKNAPGMPLPASFLVDISGVVRYTSRLDRVGEFLDPESIFPALDRLN